MFRSCRLDDIVEAVNDRTGFEKNQMLPYIGLEHLRIRGAGLNGSSLAAESISINTIFKAGDVLFGKLRPNLRKCTLAPSDGYCSTDILVLRPKDGISPRFAARVFQSDHIGAAAEMTAAGTKMPRTSWNVLRALEVYCPDIESQEAVADVLETLDVTIRQTEAIIEKLKLVKQGLLYDLLTRGIDVSGKLRPPQSQAPHLYKDSLLGWIPVEWNASNVAAEFSITSGITIGPHRIPRSNPRKYLRVANVQRARLDLSVVTELEASSVEMELRQLAIGDLLVVEGHASTEEIGRCAIADDSVCGFTFQNHLFRLRANRLDATFGLLWMNSDHVRAYWRSEAATSSGLNTINRGKLDRVLVAVPNHAEQRRIVDRINAADQRLEGETMSLEKLKAQKAGLMDDLLTGRVRVTALLDTIDT